MLTGPEQPSRSGNTKQLVVILHGWGADGINLIDLARPWGIVMPDAHFIAPNAPHLCEANPLGYQWFSLMDRSPAQMLAGVADAATHVNEFIDAKIKELANNAPPLGGSSREQVASDEARGVGGKRSSSEAIAQNINNPSRIGHANAEPSAALPQGEGKIKLALAGFSQGTMTALHVGLRRSDVDCILGYSGALLDTKEMVQNITPPLAGGHGGESTPSTSSPLNPPASGGTFPPVCLIHGEEDDVVPFSSMARAEDILKACSIDITTHARPNLPHSIDMEGVEIGGKFLLQQVG